MEYQEFVCAVERKMNTELKGGAKASIYTAVKNNGKEKRGIMIVCPGIDLSPAIYLEEFYQRFQCGEDLDEIVAGLMGLYGTIKCERSCKIPDLKNFGDIRDKIIFRLIQTEKNQAFLKEVPHIPFLDLSIVFYILLEMWGAEGTMATMEVRREHLRDWGIAKEELLLNAYQNAARLLPAQLFTMEQILADPFPAGLAKRNNLLETGEACEEAMYVLSNPQGSYGAACIAYPGVLEKIGRILGGDFYILPSSVHEVVLVPRSKAMEQYVMNEIVGEINEAQVADEDILSDHVYLYEEGTGSPVLHPCVDQCVKAGN